MVTTDDLALRPIPLGWVCEDVLKQVAATFGSPGQTFKSKRNGSFAINLTVIFWLIDCSNICQKSKPGKVGLQKGFPYL